MVEKGKWQKAQQAELNWWEESWESDIDFRWLKKRAAFYEGWLELYTELSLETKVLEIGGAALPVVDFMRTGECYGIDPLYNSYKEILDAIYKTAIHNVSYGQAPAEDTGMNSSFFDVIIMLNVLDHTYCPIKVLQEINRILKVGGIFLMSVDTMSHVWKVLKKALLLFKVGKQEGDILHPHRFTIQDIRKSFEKTFKLLHLFTSSYDSLATKEVRVPKSKLEVLLKNHQRLYIIGKKQ